MKKRLVSLLAALAMLFTLLPAGAVTAGAEVWDKSNVHHTADGKFIFAVNDENKAVIVLYTGSDADVVIPKTLDSYDVASIDEYAFSQEFNEVMGYNLYGSYVSSTPIKSVNIEADLTSIGYAAFSGCESLRTINIPDSVTEMGWRVFENCTSLETIVLPNQLKTVPTTAFSGCSALTSVTLPENLVSIEDNAFESCFQLTNIEIPNTVTTIGDGAFSWCSGEDEEGNLTGLTSISLPDSVTSIGVGTFENCYTLNRVTLSKNLKEIPESAFSGCFMDEGTIELPDGLKTIGASAFAECSGLTSINIPDTVTSIGDSAFWGCSGLESELVIPEGVTEIGSSTFLNCSSLISVSIPDTVTSIGDKAFRKCSKLEKITLSKNVSSIGEEAFWGCKKLTSVTYNGTRDQWNDLLENHTEQGNDALKSETVMVTCTGKPEEPDKPTPKPTPTPAEPADDSPDVLGTTALVVAGGLGVAAAGYAAYRMGTELYLNQVLPAGAEIPATRAQLAVLVWTDAGKPEPAAPLAEDAPEDVKALTWAVESGLMQAAKKNGEAYTAEDAVSRITVIRTWNKAQELKKSRRVTV